MVRIRLLLLWLLVLALPVQSFAAAAMVVCGALPAAAVPVAVDHAIQGTATPAPPTTSAHHNHTPSAGLVQPAPHEDTQHHASACTGCTAADHCGTCQALPLTVEAQGCPAHALPGFAASGPTLHLPAGISSPPDKPPRA